MKKFKYFTILSLLLTTAIFVYKYQFKDKEAELTSSWKTYKKEGKVVSSHVTTKQEAKKARIVTSVKRSPASKKLTTPKKRVLTGRLAKEYGSRDLKINYLNSPSKDWKEKYAKLKLHTLKTGTKLLIKHNKSILKVTKKGAIYLEKVIISIQREGKAPSSYEAMINSETGQQVAAWNRTHHENVDHVLFSKKL